MPSADLCVDSAGGVTMRGAEVFLRGARSGSSGVQVFPAADICPKTGARDMELVEFGPEATLYSFSTVHVSATRPTPYTLGYIDFPGGLRVLAQIRATPEQLRCDLPVRLAADGHGWWAEPVGAVQ